MHSGLVAEDIRNLARAVRTVDVSDDIISALKKNILDRIEKRFEGNRKLKSDDLRTIMTLCDRAIVNAIDPVDFGYKTIKPTRTHPKGEEFEACYVGVKRMNAQEVGRTDLFQLFTFRIYATRKLLRIDQGELPLAIQYHAAKRYIERTGSDGSAINGLATELLRWSPALDDLHSFASKHTTGHLVLPTTDESGAIMCRFIDRETRPMQRTSSDGRFHPHTTTCRRKLHPLLLVNTFVDRELLRPAQSYTMNRLCEWHLSHSATLHETQQKIVWPYDMKDDHLKPVVLEEISRADLLDIMKDPVVIRSMHPDREINYSQYSDKTLPLGNWKPRRLNVENSDTDGSQPSALGDPAP